MAIPLIPVAIEGLKTTIITVGAILSGILLGNLATDIINDNQDESENQKAESVKQQLESNAQATSPSPVPPDDGHNNDDDPKFKDSKETAKKFNTDSKNFERNIKKDILKDAKFESKSNNQLKKFLDKNKNPDIGVDSNGDIWLKSRGTGQIIKTQLNKNMYID